MRKRYLLASLPLLSAALPAHACVSEVPTFSVQDLSAFAFAFACVASLLMLGYMHLPTVAKTRIKQAMAVSIMALVGLVVLGATWIFAAPTVMSWMQPAPTPANLRPLKSVPVTPPANPLMVTF